MSENGDSGTFSQNIDSNNKGCVMFLLDQSFSMDEPIGNTSIRKCDQLALSINKWLENLVLANAAGEDSYKDRFDIGVIGYRTDLDGNPIIENALKAPLNEKDLVTVAELAEHAEYVEMVEKYFDEETGEIAEDTVENAVWIHPVYEGGTPMCSALLQCYTVLNEWIGRYPDSFPPLIIHITDGENIEETEDEPDPVVAPIAYSESVRGLATNDGNVLLLNCHLSMMPADGILFPASDELLPEDLARVLFKMSSVLPQKMCDLAKEAGFELQDDARAMAFNADTECLLKFLDIGTKVATKLR